MIDAEVRAGLRAIVAQPGIRASALVDLSGGMVLLWEGPADLLPVAEAASDYWRLCTRQEKVLGVLGPPLAQVLMHANTRVTIVPCGAGLLLVTLSKEGQPVDWDHWKRLAKALQPIAEQL